MIWPPGEWTGKGRRKFTDEQLFEALASEPSQNAAARRLGVTSPAVCKRLRRMRAAGQLGVPAETLRRAG